jgi:hypothetical protein
MTRIFQWFRHAEIDDALRMGWVFAPCSGAMHHHTYSFMFEWLCDCDVPRIAR